MAELHNVPIFEVYETLSVPFELQVFSSSSYSEYLGANYCRLHISFNAFP